MSAKFLSFNQKLNQLVAQPLDRRKVTSCVVAQYIADCITIPTEEQGGIESYYQNTIKTQVLDMLGPLNESLTLDPKYTQECVRQYWMLRYVMTYPTMAKRRKYSALYGYFDTVMGVGIYIDEEHHAFVNQYKLEIFSLYNDLCDIESGEDE